MSVSTSAQISDSPRPRGGFTLVELLVTIAIIAILAGLVLGGLYAAKLAGERSRTEAMIRKLEPAILARYESYRSRRLPMDPRDMAIATLIMNGNTFGEAYNRIYNGRNPDNSAFNSRSYIEGVRLAVLRELMRLEMPQRYEDVTQLTGQLTNAQAPLTVFFGPNAALLPAYGTMAATYRYIHLPLPPLCDAYRNRLGTTTTSDNQGAECLYMIVTQAQLETEETGLELFRQLDIGDVDDDGAPEFHDAWGNPIAWLRWPAGFHNFEPDPAITNRDNPFSATTPAMANAKQPLEVSNYQRDPRGDVAGVQSFFDANCDPLDVLKVDRPPTGTTTHRGYVVRPLIYSGGPDREFDIVAWMDLTSAGSSLQIATALNDPYYVNPATGRMIGSPYDQHLGDDNSLGTGDDNPLVESGLNFMDNIHNHRRTAERGGR